MLNLFFEKVRSISPSEVVQAHAGHVTRLAINANGSQVVSVGADHRIVVWMLSASLFGGVSMTKVNCACFCVLCARACARVRVFVCDVCGLYSSVVYIGADNRVNYVEEKHVPHSIFLILYEF